MVKPKAGVLVEQGLLQEGKRTVVRKCHCGVRRPLQTLGCVAEQILLEKAVQKVLPPGESEQSTKWGQRTVNPLSAGPTNRRLIQGGLNPGMQGVGMWRAHFITLYKGLEHPGILVSAAVLALSLWIQRDDCTYTTELSWLNAILHVEMSAI